jgi:type II secretory pathway component PulM
VNNQSLWASRSPRERALVLLGVGVIAVAVWMILSPTDAGKRGLLPSSVAREQYSDGLKRKQGFDREVATLGPKVDTSTYKETSEKVIPVVLKVLHEQARAAGIHLREVKPLRPRQVAGLTKVTLTVRFTSEFGKAIPFLYGVEDPKGRLVVEKMNVAASDPKSRQVDVEVQVALFAAGAPPKVEGSGKAG